MKRNTLYILDDSELDLAILNEIFKRDFQVTCFSSANLLLSALREQHLAAVTGAPKLLKHPYHPNCLRCQSGKCDGRH